MLRGRKRDKGVRRYDLKAMIGFYLSIGVRELPIIEEEKGTIEGVICTCNLEFFCLQ